MARTMAERVALSAEIDRVVNAATRGMEPLAAARVLARARQIAASADAPATPPADPRDGARGAAREGHRRDAAGRDRCARAAAKAAGVSAAEALMPRAGKLRPRPCPRPFPKRCE